MGKPDSGRPGADPAREAIYRAIQILLFLDLVLGLGLALVGAVVLEVDSIVYAGLGLAAVGLVLMVFFRALAGREAASRSAGAEAADQQRRLRKLTGRGGPHGDGPAA